MKCVYEVEMSISRDGELLSTNRTYFDSQELAQKVLENQNKLIVNLSTKSNTT